MSAVGFIGAMDSRPQWSRLNGVSTHQLLDKDYTVIQDLSERVICLETEVCNNFNVIFLYEIQALQIIHQNPTINSPRDHHKPT